MVPPHGNCEARKELNHKIYILLKHARWSSRRIAKELGIGKSRVQKVVKRENLQGGHVGDTWCSKRPWKVTTF